MSSARRHPIAAVLLAAALACSSGTKKPLACQADADCPSEAKCVLGACVAGSLPQARIVLRAAAGELVSNRMITFDGSQSQDTNPGGALKRFAWAVRRGAGAACDPSARSGGDPTFSTIFQCAGQYQVELKVTNDLGMDSLPEQATLEIAQAMDPPVVTAMGPALTVIHRCEGSPLLCRALDGAGRTSFQLAAAATDVQDGAALSYAWTYQAPAGVDLARTRVVFQPDAATPSPLVQIETDGTPIAGEWIFQALVTDSDRLTAVGEQRLTVANGAPTVAVDGATITLEHQYLAVGRYVATATVRAAIADPDGDPLSTTDVSLEETPASDCTFRVTSSQLDQGQLAADVELSCPGGSPQSLIGAVARQLVTRATDHHGATGEDARPLVVGNNQPTLTWTAGGVPGTYPVPHAVVPCPDGASTPSCFAVDAALPFAVGDLDGDPVAVALSAGGLPPGKAWFTAGDGGRRFSLLVPVTQPALLRDASGMSPLTFGVAASDPFTASAPTQASFGLLVGNAAPAVTLLPGAPAAGHWYSTADRAYHVTFELATAADPEGDPLTPLAASSDGICAATGLAGDRIQVACTLPYDYAQGGPLALLDLVYTPRTVWAAARDPWAASLETPHVALAVQDRAPVLQNQGTISAFGPCTCNATACEWVPSGPGTATLDPGASDPDGDPLHLTVTFASGAPGLAKVCLGAGCAVTFSTSGDTATVTLSDGVQEAGRSYPVVRECSNGVLQQCGPLPGRVCP